MLKTLIGAQAFARGMDLYFTRCDGMAATMEDFLACFAQASGRDLALFQRWYAQAGTPVLHVESRHDPEAKTFTLDISQTTPATPGQPDKLPFVIPIALGLIAPDGAPVPLAAVAEHGATAGELASGIFELSGHSRRIVFTEVAQSPVPSLLRGFSAPVRVEANLRDADLLHLAAHDSDTFNRWQAVQSLAVKLLIRSVEALRAGLPCRDEPAFAAAVGAALAHNRADPALAAQIIALPSEADLAREIAGDVDTDAIRTAREHLRHRIGLALQDLLQDIYRGLADNGPYDNTAASAGRRALRNGALHLLAAGDSLAGESLAQAQFATARNMTDQFAALDILARAADTLRQPALDAFYAQHAGDALVIDKWFQVQAMAPAPQTLDRVKALTRHDVFSFSNPNRIRALIGSFAHSNQVGFHAADGRGYDFLVEIVLRLDTTNPQMAARLLGAMRSWRTLEEGRRSKAQAALTRVASTARLSADVRDIVTRSLV